MVPWFENAPTIEIQYQGGLNLEGGTYIESAPWRRRSSDEQKRGLDGKQDDYNMHLLGAIRVERFLKFFLTHLHAPQLLLMGGLETFCSFHLSVVMEDGRPLLLDDRIIDASHATTTWKERALFGSGAWRWRDLGY